MSIDSLPEDKKQSGEEKSQAGIECGQWVALDNRRSTEMLNGCGNRDRTEQDAQTPLPLVSLVARCGLRNQKSDAGDDEIQRRNVGEGTDIR